MPKKKLNNPPSFNSLMQKIDKYFQGKSNEEIKKEMEIMWNTPCIFCGKLNKDCTCNISLEE